MAAVGSYTSTVLMDDPSKENTSEDVQNASPSYEQLFGQSNTSHNPQSQSQLIVYMGNDQCQQPFVSVELVPEQQIYSIESHIGWSILNILCCCWCLGCVACCFSMETKDLKKQGDIQGALKASKAARKWNTYATLFGIIIFLIYIIYYATIIYKRYSG